MGEFLHYLKCLGIVIVAIPTLLGILALIFTQLVPCLIVGCVLWLAYYIYCIDREKRKKKQRDLNVY